MDAHQKKQPEKPKKSIQICKNKRFVWTFPKIINPAVARGFPMILLAGGKAHSAPFCLLSAVC